MRDEGWYKSKATNGHLEIEGDAYLTVMSKFLTLFYVKYFLRGDDDRKNTTQKMKTLLALNNYD